MNTKPSYEEQQQEQSIYSLKAQRINQRFSKYADKVIEQDPIQRQGQENTALLDVLITEVEKLVAQNDTTNVVQILTSRESKATHIATASSFESSESQHAQLQKPPQPSVPVGKDLAVSNPYELLESGIMKDLGPIRVKNHNSKKDTGKRTHNSMTYKPTGRFPKWDKNQKNWSDASKDETLKQSEQALQGIGNKKRKQLEESKKRSTDTTNTTDESQIVKLMGDVDKMNLIQRISSQQKVPMHISSTSNFPSSDALPDHSWHSVSSPTKKEPADVDFDSIAKNKILKRQNQYAEVCSAPEGISSLREILPRKNDVLNGRGNGVQYHLGNIYFRKKVHDYKMKYMTCKKGEKRIYREYIYNEIRCRGGRFLERDKYCRDWFEMSKEKAFEKIGQALRQGGPKIREKLVEEKDDNSDDLSVVKPLECFEHLRDKLRDETHNKKDTSATQNLTPEVNDILFGRDNLDHFGNKYNSKILEKCKEQMKNSEKDVKRKKCKDVYLMIKNSKPPGRFLEKCNETNDWVEMNEEKAIEVTLQSLRKENGPSKKTMPKLFEKQLKSLESNKSKILNPYNPDLDFTVDISDNLTNDEDLRSTSDFCYNDEKKYESILKVGHQKTAENIVEPVAYHSFLEHVLSKSANDEIHEAHDMKYLGIDRPHIHDVLSGRGNDVQYHIGNMHFRELVKKETMAYVTCKRGEKKELLKKVYEKIKNLNPPGRFLRKDIKMNQWVEISIEEALAKIGEAIRKDPSKGKKKHVKAEDKQKHTVDIKEVHEEISDPKLESFAANLRLHDTSS